MNRLRLLINLKFQLVMEKDMNRRMSLTQMIDTLANMDDELFHKLTTNLSYMPQITPTKH